MKNIHLKEILPHVEEIARRAGAEIMKHYGSATVYTKDDGSNVTDADHAAEKVILPALRALTPEIPIISEEDVSLGATPAIGYGTFWTVDPLDGTHEFIKRTDAFVVAIALVDNHRPVLGVIYHPSLNLLYSGYGPGTASKTGPDGTRMYLAPAPVIPDNPRVIISTWRTDRPKIEAFLARRFPGKTPSIDDRSGIFRACRVAEGLADISISHPDRPHGHIAFWDVAPGQAIVESAGGRVERLDGGVQLYNSDDLNVLPYAAFSPGWVKAFS